MSKKHLKRLLNHVDKHLMLSIDLIVSIDQETRKGSHTSAQKVRTIKRMIQTYKGKTKGVIEF